MIHRIEPARENRLEQLFLATEVIVDRRKVHTGCSGDRAKAGGLEPVLHEEAFRGVENALLRGSRTARCRHGRGICRNAASAATFVRRYVVHHSVRPRMSQSFKRSFESYAGSVTRSIRGRARIL